MKYVYIVSTMHFGPVGSSNQAILGVHTSKRSGNQHYDAVLDDRRSSKLLKHIAFSGAGYGDYPKELMLPDLTLRQVMIDFTDGTSERVRLVRWHIVKPSELKKGKREHDRSNRASTGEHREGGSRG